MSTLAFAETHNLVAYLEKPSESAGFEQILDFLNAHPIRYALTVNPTIYVSCIKQFCNSDVSKRVNEEVQIHATVDGKKIVITESFVRRTLHLVDDGGVDCLPTYAIFENLALLGFCNSTVSKTVNEEVQIHATVDGKKIVITESSVRRTLHLVDDGGVDCLPTSAIFENLALLGPRKGFTSNVTPLTPIMVALSQTQMGEDIVVDEAVHKERSDSFERAATTVASLDAEQDNGGGPGCQETIGDILAQTRFERVSNMSNDPLLAEGNTSRSGEDSLKLTELMETCTKLSQRVLGLEDELKQTKLTYNTALTTLIKRVKKLERRNNLGEEDASKQGRKIQDIDAAKNIYLVNIHKDTDVFGVNELEGDEVFVDAANDEVFVEQEVIVDVAHKVSDVMEEVTDVINAALNVSAVAPTVNVASEIPVSAVETTIVVAAITPKEITLA
ncbi:hypothetical protein Tco_0809352 [Tanacetum coccineum]